MKKINWQKVIQDLQKQGYTQRQIEAETGVPQCSISKMVNGGYVDPSWSTGHALLTLLNGE